MLRRTMGETRDPIGVVLAGGAGRRMGGAKAVVALHGTPLLAYPVAALQAVLGDVAVVAKADSELPSLPGVAVWTEPDEPRHPLAGVVHALERAGGRGVLVCAGDLPFVSAALVRTLRDADPGAAPAVVARAGGRLQPLVAHYRPAAHAPLVRELAAGASLTAAVERLAPRVLALDDERPFFNVNAPEDLLTAAAMIDRGA
jgi:molybdenum cofactor guanylyltransferase